MKRLAFVLALTAALAPAAHAAEYTQVDAARSTLHFGYKQMGVAMDGKFRKFASQLSFDPARPTAAKAAIDVELASIDAGSGEANDEVAGKQWFNTKAFPTARFVSTGVKPTGANRYEVAGTLTIKGKTQNVVVPASFTSQGNLGAFDGLLTIRRGDFSIGEGPWAAFDIVANDIQIKFHIAASAGK